MAESLISNLGKGLQRPKPKERLTAYGQAGMQMKELMSQAQPDSIDAKEELSREMTKLMIERIDDFKNTTSRIQSILTEDISEDYNVLDLAYKYLKISDHKGPGMSKRQKRTLLRKVESLESLAKRLNGGQDPISSDVRKGTDLYDLRSHFKGTRGSAEAEAKMKAKAEEKKRRKAMERRKSGVKIESTLDRLSKGKKKSRWNKFQIKRHEISLQKMVQLAKMRQDKIDAANKEIKDAIRKRAEVSREYRKILQGIADSYATRGVNPGHDMFYREGAPPPFKLKVDAVLGHVASAISLQEGRHAEKLYFKYMLSTMSQDLFTRCFWACHCKFFQKNSDEIVHNLVHDLSSTYVKIINSIQKETHKTLFFKYFIYTMAHAVAIGYFYHCPGSRNMYDQSQTSFKLDVYIFLSETLSGMQLLPASANIMSTTLFNEPLDIQKKRRGSKDGDEDESESSGPAISSADKLNDLIAPNKKKKKSKKDKGKPKVYLLFSGQALWIPVGNIGKSPGQAANAGVSPMIEQYLSRKTFETKKRMSRTVSKKKVDILPSSQILRGSGSPLSLKRSGPPRKSYRLPTAAAKVVEMRETMKDLQAKYKYKVRQCNSDIRSAKKELRASLSDIERHRGHLLKAGVEERQRFTFSVTQQAQNSRKDKFGSTM